MWTERPLRWLSEAKSSACLHSTTHRYSAGWVDTAGVEGNTGEAEAVTALIFRFYFLNIALVAFFVLVFVVLQYNSFTAAV